MDVITYNKLVRDKIPEIIKATGKKCETEILSDDDYLKMIDAKMDEELAEYHQDQNIEELADLMEVIYAAAQARGYSLEELEKVRMEKAEKRGAFKDKILLKEVREKYKFWGWEHAHTPAVCKDYKGIKKPTDLYDALSNIWCADTCAPRMRENWTRENMTLGQCSITAFLAQDIFGGKVYGILRPGGNYHCYNVVGDCRFDLTSEQFGDEVLCYEDNPEQFREDHFAKEEKRLRYEHLKAELTKYCG